jgi:hypothetical protein
MRHRSRAIVLAVSVSAIVATAVMWTLEALAQGRALTDEQIAKLGPAEPTPRLVGGTPNLGRVPGERGVWTVPNVADMGDYLVRLDGTTIAEGRGGARGEAVGPGSAAVAAAEPHVPAMPWAAAIRRYHAGNDSKYDPEGYCLPPGGPRMMATPYPMEIVQLPEQKRIFMIFEGAAHVWREIYMDGRPHPEGDALNPTYLGHSVGRWEGDTLVVDVVGFNEGTWLDHAGHPHTDQMHLVERFSRPSKRVLRYEATINDPGAYTKSFTIRWNLVWNPTGELSEYICQENNRYLHRWTDDFGQSIFGNR